MSVVRQLRCTHHMRFVSTCRDHESSTRAISGARTAPACLRASAASRPRFPPPPPRTVSVRTLLWPSSAPSPILARVFHIRQRPGNRPDGHTGRTARRKPSNPTLHEGCARWRRCGTSACSAWECRPHGRHHPRTRNRSYTKRECRRKKLKTAVTGCRKKPVGPI